MATQVVELTGDEAKLFRSLDKVIKKEREHERQLAKTANQGADVGDKLDRAGRRGEMSADKSRKSWDRFGKTATTQVVALVGALGVGGGLAGAISTVNDYLREQEELLEESLSKQLQLARAQQDAAKNLAGISVVERSELLRDAVPDIASDTGFSDLAEITQALGSVASAGESNPELIANAVRQAARVERLTPDNLDTTAASSSAVQRQAGLSDVRQGIALVETTGTQARITDPGKLLESLPKAIGSAVSTVRGQDPEQAARQAAALFAQVTQGGNDERGLPSTTFTQDFTNRLRKFFVGIEDERIQARSQIEKLDRKDTLTEAEAQTRQRLTDFLQSSQGVQDPGTLFGRLEVLQEREPLAQRFKGEGFGEKQFQVTLDDLLNAESERSKALRESFSIIKADVSFFEREARELQTVTPQISIANLEAATTATDVAQVASDIEGGTLAEVRKIIATSLQKTRGEGFLQGLGQSIAETGIGRGIGLAGSTPLEEAAAGVELLQNRRRALQRDGVTPAEQPKIDRLSSDIRSLIEFIDRSAGEFAPGTVEAGRERTATLIELNRRSEAIVEDKPFLASETQQQRDQVARELRELMEALRESNNEVAEAIREGNQHAAETAQNTRKGQRNLGQSQRNARQ